MHHRPREPEADSPVLNYRYGTSNPGLRWWSHPRAFRAEIFVAVVTAVCCGITALTIVLMSISR